MLWQFELEANLLINVAHPNLPQGYDHFSQVEFGGFLQIGSGLFYSASLKRERSLPSSSALSASSAVNSSYFRGKGTNGMLAV